MVDDVESQPGGVGAEAPRGKVVQAHAVFEVADDVLDLGVTPVVGFELERGAGMVGDEGVVGELGEQGQLAARRRPYPANDEPTRPALGAEGLIGGLDHVGTVEEVGNRCPSGLVDGLDQLSQAFGELDRDRIARVS